MRINIVCSYKNKIFVSYTNTICAIDRANEGVGRSAVRSCLSDHQ